MFYAQARQDKFVVNILKEKKNGYFLEIGSWHPIQDNNTFILERCYNWKGIMIEQHDMSYLYKQYRPNSIYSINDATKINYKDLFLTNNMPHNMDYLQIDLDVHTRGTLTVLELLDKEIFDLYKFATITFEHDIYGGDHFETRAKSRQIFNNRNYILIFADVCDHSSDRVFEDWYVHPDLVDMDYVNKIMQNNIKNYDDNSITGKSINCQNISYFL